jgi:hypothetical protein
MEECRVCEEGSIPTQKTCRSCLLMLKPSYITNRGEDMKRDQGFDPFETCELCKNQDNGWDIEVGRFKCKDSCELRTRIIPK